MVSSIDLPLHNRMGVHRVASPRPVELAQPPAGASPAAGAASSVGAPPPAPMLNGETLGQLLGIRPEWIGGGSALSAARAAGAYGLASMPKAEALTPTAPKFAYEEVSALGFIPGEVLQSNDPGAMTDYMRDEVARAREAARREQAISDQAGVEVRLAYDPNTAAAVVLRPGDEGYAEVRGARAMFERMAWDLQKMGEKLSDYQDLLPL